MTEDTVTTPTMEKNDTEGMSVTMHATVILGGQERVFKVKTIAETIGFRTKAGEMFGAVYGPLVAARGNQSPASVAAVTERMMPNLMGKGFSDFLALIPEYAPELKDYLGDATEDETLDAAMEVLRVALPLVEKVLNTIIKVRRMLEEAEISL